MSRDLKDDKEENKIEDNIINKSQLELLEDFYTSRNKGPPITDGMRNYDSRRSQFINTRYTIPDPNFTNYGFNNYKILNYDYAIVIREFGEFADTKEDKNKKIACIYDEDDKNIDIYNISGTKYISKKHIDNVGGEHNIHNCNVFSYTYILFIYLLLHQFS